MKKVFSVIFFFCLFGYCFTQTSYYFKPTLDNKIYIGNADNLLGGLHAIESSPDNNSFLENQYFKAINIKFSSRACYNFGLYFGISLKNKKHLIEFGFTQDATGTQFKNQFMEYKVVSKNDTLIEQYSKNQLVFASSLFTFRYHLQYGLRLNKSQNNRVVTYAIIGGGIIQNKSYPGQEEIESSNIGPAYSQEFAGNFYLDEDTYIYKMDNYGFATDKFSGYLNIGISTDFYTKKGRQMFSASLFYLQGFKPIELSYHDTYIMDNTENKLISYRTTSNGSGIYFQISRRFQFSPWPARIKNS